MWTVSNLISLLRLLAAAPFACVFWHENHLWVIILVAFAFLSDYLDGFFARKLKQKSELGKILDPIADKVFMGTGVVVMLLKGMIPLWFGIAVVARDLLILAGGLYAKRRLGIVLPSNMTGKITVNILFLVLIGIYFGNELMQEYGLWLALLALIVSFIVYLTGMIDKLMRHSSARK